MATPRSRRPRNSLTLDEIVAAARAELQEVSLERLSMRAVANRLGASPMALYNHVPSKEALVDELLDRTLGEIDTDVAGEWADAIVELSRRLLAHLVANPWAVPALMARPDPGESATALGEAFLGQALRGGLDPRSATIAFTGVLAITYGAAGFLAPKPVQQDLAAVEGRIRSAEGATAEVVDDLVQWNDPANVPVMVRALLLGLTQR